LLFTPAAPPRTVQYVPGHNRWHPDIPAIAEVIAGGSLRLNCRGADILCGPIGVVGAEPGDLVMIEILGLGRLDGHFAGANHPGILRRPALSRRGRMPDPGRLAGPAGPPHQARHGAFPDRRAGPHADHDQFSRRDGRGADRRGRLRRARREEEVNA
jgi:Acetamidase/Formamidase family